MCTQNTLAVQAIIHLSVPLVAPLWYPMTSTHISKKWHYTNKISRVRDSPCSAAPLVFRLLSELCCLCVTDSGSISCGRELHRLIILCGKVKKSWKQFSVSIVPRVQEQSLSPLPIFCSMPSRLSGQNPSWWRHRSGSCKHSPRWNFTHEQPTDFSRCQPWIWPQRF